MGHLTGAAQTAPLISYPVGERHICATTSEPCTFFTTPNHANAKGNSYATMHRHRDSVKMAGLSDNVNVNTDAPQENNNNNPNTCVDPLPGFHIYSWSERHRNRVIPAHLTYQSRPVPSLPNPPKRPQYPDERSRLLLEGLRNNGRFVLTGILNDLEDERRAEEARAQKALETEHAALKRKKEAKQTAATSAASIETETEQTIEAGRQIETDQTRQTPPSFDTEFDEDRGIFSDPLAEFNGEDPFADFDGNHTQLHSEINYQEDRGNLSESDSNTSGGYESDNEESDGEEESSSEEGSDQDTEEGSSSEDEFHGTDPFADFSGDYTHLNGPIDFGEDLTDGSTSEEDSETGLELGRTPESEQDVNQGLEQDHDIEIYDDEDMDSIDEILAAAHSADFTHEEGDEDEDMGDDVDLDYEDGEDIEDEDDHDLDALPLAPFNPIAMGLKEIGGLAHFRVSSYKPGNGVDELKNDDTDRYWQYVSLLDHAFPPSANSCVIQVRRRPASPSNHGLR